MDEGAGEQLLLYSVLQGLSALGFTSEFEPARARMIFCRFEQSKVDLIARIG